LESVSAAALDHGGGPTGGLVAQRTQQQSAALREKVHRLPS
jgi:hypothetical protein